MPVVSLEQLAIAAIGLPVAAALLAFALDRASTTARSVLVVASLLANLGLAVSLAAVGLSQPATGHFVAPLGSASPAGLLLVVDRAGSLALVVVALVCLVVGVYSIGYVEPSRLVAGYFALAVLAAGALNALILAGDLVTLAVALIALGATLGGIVGLDFGRAGGTAATKVLLSFVGSAALAASAASLMNARGGSPRLDAVLATDGSLGPGVLLAVPLAAVLIAVPLATAAALAPAHTWLTSAARRALPPMGALLIAGAVPAGASVALRVLGGPPADERTLAGVTLLGAASVLVGALGGLRSAELVPAAAFQVVGQTGLAAVALAQGTDQGRSVALLQVSTAPVFASLLVLGVAAALRPLRGTELAGFASLRSGRPLAAALALVGAAGLAGLPPFPGFWLRVSLAELLLSPDRDQSALLLAFLVGTTLLTTALLRLVSLEPPLATSVPTPKRNLGMAVPLVGLGALAVALAFLRPDIAAGLLGASVEPEGGALIPIGATLVVLGGLAAAIALRLGELGLLPSRPQRLFAAADGRMARFVALATRAQKRLPAGWLDPYALASALLAVVAWTAALVLENTLGRLGRDAG